MSVFRIPPSFNSTADSVGDLPSPGAVALPGMGSSCRSDHAGDATAATAVAAQKRTAARADRAVRGLHVAYVLVFSCRGLTVEAIEAVSAGGAHALLDGGEPF